DYPGSAAVLGQAPGTMGAKSCSRSSRRRDCVRRTAKLRQAWRRCRRNEVREHQFALSVLGEQVVGDAVALAGCPVPVKLDCALTVEVLCGLVAVEVLEHRGQRL